MKDIVIVTPIFPLQIKENNRLKNSALSHQSARFCCVLPAVKMFAILNVTIYFMYGILFPIDYIKNSSLKVKHLIILLLWP